MRALAILFVLAGCDDSGPEAPRADGGPVTADASILFDLSGDFPDGGCAANEECRGDGGSRYFSCLQGRCVECVGDSDCTSLALGPDCVANHCTCVSAEDCSGRATGPVCSGLPAFCGCTSPADCPSGICAPDDYVAGFVCAP